MSAPDTSSPLTNKLRSQKHNHEATREEQPIRMQANDDADCGDRDNGQTFPPRASHGHLIGHRDRPY